MADYDELLRRRRIWGVPLNVVTYLLAECERAQERLSARIAELEEQLAHTGARRDEAERAIAAHQAKIARLEQEKEVIANRPEAVREEAVRFVVDAWAEARALREQTQQEIAAAQQEAREEVTAIRRQMAEERQRLEEAMHAERERHESDMQEARKRYETEIAMLRERRQRAVAELESFAAGLLNQAGRGIAAPNPPPDTPDAAAKPAEPAARASVPEPAARSSSAAQPESPAGTTSAEDELLAKALDELEAILSTPRKMSNEQ